jgi:AAA+ superfamily predicted ATPase
MDRIKFRSDFFSILQFRHLGNMFHIRKFESAYKPVLRDRGELQLVLPACRVDLWCWGSFQTVVVSERDFSVNDGKVTLQLAHHNGTYTHFIVDGKKLPIRYGLVENITIRILSPGDYTGWGKEEFFPYGRTHQFTKQPLWISSITGEHCERHAFKKYVEYLGGLSNDKLNDQLMYWLLGTEQQRRNVHDAEGIQHEERDKHHLQMHPLADPMWDNFFQQISAVNTREIQAIFDRIETLENSPTAFDWIGIGSFHPTFHCIRYKLDLFKTFLKKTNKSDHLYLADENTCISLGNMAEYAIQHDNAIALEILLKFKDKSVVKTINQKNYVIKNGYKMRKSVNPENLELVEFARDSKKTKCVNILEYVVEKVLDQRGSGKHRRLLVKWEGCKKPTWEPYHNMVKDVPSLVAAFENPDQFDKNKESDQKYVDRVKTTIAKSDISFDSIKGQDDLIVRFKKLVTLKIYNPQYVANNHGFLFYGPPGTGKTMLAKAIANFFSEKCVFFKIQPSEIFDKYIGEGEKFVKYLFRVARSNEHSIIFIDECECIFGERSKDHAGVQNQFLAELSEKNENVLIICATNLPSQINGAVLRRISNQFYIPLPNSETRRDLIGSNLPTHELSASEIEEFVERTDGYSGSDIVQMCKRLNYEQVFEHSEEQMRGSLNLRKINYTDLEREMNSYKSTVKVEDVQLCKSFAGDIVSVPVELEGVEFETENSQVPPGFVEHRVPGDGNCLYYAVLEACKAQNIPPQYSGSLMEQQSQLRSDVLDESNRREVPINEEVRAHIHGWGGQLEQYLIERRFDININVFDRRRQAWIDRRDPPCISLIFNGSHYNWLERREVPRTPAIVDHTGLPIHPFLSDLGVRYYESFLPPKLNESISKFIIEQEKFKRAFFASNFSSFSKRDNVKKFILTYFRKNEDPHSEIITAGTGHRNVYDWTQTPECYGTPYVRNVCEFPQAVEFIGFLNERFKEKLNGHKFNSLYFIYYREGVLGKGKNKSMGDFINPHHDKDATFQKDAPFVLYNHLSEGEPRRFAFLEKDDLIEEFAMKDNDALFVSAEANRAVKHALKQELDWKGFRASIVARCISDHIVVKPSESRTVEYNGRTPTDIQRNPIEYSVRINGKYTHAAELIQQREQRDMFLFQAKSFSESGQTKELEVLLNSAVAKLIYTRDYSYAYRRFVCRMNTAKTPNELEDAFLWFESLGKKFTKAISKDWEGYKRKKRKKYKF